MQQKINKKAPQKIKIFINVYVEKNTTIELDYGDIKKM